MTNHRNEHLSQIKRTELKIQLMATRSKHDQSSYLDEQDSPGEHIQEPQ